MIRSTGSRLFATLLILVAAASAVAARPSERIVAYEMDGRVVVECVGWAGPPVRGEAPAVSPTGDSVAFLRDGNVFIVDRKGARVTQLTHSAPFKARERNSEPALPNRVSWSPSGRRLAYTRAEWYHYDKRTNSLWTQIPGKREGEYDSMITTIRFADRGTGRSRMVLGPMSGRRLRAMAITGQLWGASVFEPVFSPDERRLWFLNPGDICEAAIDPVELRAAGRPHIVDRVGSLDLALDPHGSKCGDGPKNLAWDSTRQRLCYSTGRFWGSPMWVARGYMAYRNGKLGKDNEWRPPIDKSLSVRSPAYPDCDGLVFDEDGALWVSTFDDAPASSDSDVRWVRSDAKQSLPVGADSPSFGRVVCSGGTQ